MYSLIIYLMIFSSFVSFFLGSFMGSLIVYFNTFFLLLSLLLTNIVFFETLINNFVTNVRLVNWFYSLNMYFNFEIVFDQLSTTMLYVILIISFFVHTFSIFYMKFDPNYNKFFSFLTLFTLFMSILVLSNNFIQFFLGWEGIGLCSYLLINFWTTRLEANKSAIKALILNKIGDCSLYIFFVFYYFAFDSFDINFAQVLSLNFVNFYIINMSIYDFLVFFVIIASMAKSAQFGLHVWLPDAMEGPTPVSSLLHAATMVTAGIYLLLRISWIIDLSNFSCIILFIGCFTNFFTSIVSMFQFDLKKVIAYSTASQIALMFIAVGCSVYNIAIFHLFTHAFFKALLFLSAGVIIHIFKNLQDFRNFDESSSYLFFIYNVVTLADLVLSGLPFASSYYSKDAIVYIAGINLDYLAYISFIFCDLSVIFTIFYVFRSIIFSFINEKNLEMFKNKLNEYDFYGFLPLYILSFFSIFIGYIYTDFFNDNINDTFKNTFIFNFNNSSIFVDFYTLEYSDIFIMSFSFLGLLIGYNYDLIRQKLKLFFNKEDYKIFVLKNKKWFFDCIYYFFVILILNYSFIYFYKFIDKILYDFMSNKEFINLFKEKSLFFSKIQLGQIHFYIFIIIYFLFFIFYFLSIQYYLIYFLIIFGEFWCKKTIDGKF